MSDERPEPSAPPQAEAPKIWARKRMPFGASEGAKPDFWRSQAALFFLVAMTLGFAGLATYNGMVQRLPLTSPYVIAPALGAIWFGLRVFMTLTPKR